MNILSEFWFKFEFFCYSSLGFNSDQWSPLCSWRSTSNSNHLIIVLSPKSMIRCLKLRSSGRKISWNRVGDHCSILSNVKGSKRHNCLLWFHIFLAESEGNLICMLLSGDNPTRQEFHGSLRLKAVQLGNWGAVPHTIYCLYS